MTTFAATGTAWSAPPEEQPPPVPAVSPVPPGADQVTMVRQVGGDAANVTPEAAADTDAATYAAQFGTTLDGARSALARADALSSALARMEAAFPDAFAGGWIDHQPEVRATARFTRAVPEEAAVLVGPAGAHLTLRGGAPFSLQALQQAADRVHASLQDVRPTVATTFDVRTGRVETTVERLPDEAGVPVEVLRGRLPAQARAADVRVEFVPAPAAAGEHTRGGALTPGDAGGTCTTGFSVAKNGVYGFSTAGHCANARDYQEPGGGLRYDAPYVSPQHRGEWGDFQWHTTSHNEYAQFYVSSTGYRDVFGADTSLAGGDYVCKYGRTTGYGCSTIYRTSVSVTFDGITHGRLVAMAGYITDGGDSGGPWFNGNYAMGVHSGYWQETSTTRRSTWSRIGYQDEALGVALVVR